MDRVDRKRVQVLCALESCPRGTGGELLASQVMTAEPNCVAAHTPAVDVVRTLQAKGYRHLLVTDEGGRLVGVISDRDMLAWLGSVAADKRELSRTVAGDLMSTDLVTISPHTPVALAIDLLIEHGISCLPVVDGPRLLGIMTNTDLHVLLQTLLQTIRLASSEQPSAAIGG